MQLSNIYHFKKYIYISIGLVHYNAVFTCKSQQARDKRMKMFATFLFTLICFISAFTIKNSSAISEHDQQRLDGQKALDEIRDSMSPGIRTMNLGPTNESAFAAITAYGDGNFEKGVNNILTDYYDLDVKLISKLVIIDRPYDQPQGKVNNILRPFAKTTNILFPKIGDETPLLFVDRVWTEYSEGINTELIRFAQQASDGFGKVAASLQSPEALNKVKNLIVLLGNTFQNINTVYTVYANQILEMVEKIYNNENIRELPDLITEASYNLRQIFSSFEFDYSRKLMLYELNINRAISNAEISDNDFATFVRSLPKSRPSDRNRYNAEINKVSKFLGNDNCTMDELYDEIISPDITNYAAVHTFKNYTLCFGLFNLEATYQLSNVLVLTQDRAKYLQNLNPNEFIKRNVDAYNTLQTYWKNTIPTVFAAIVKVIQTPRVVNLWQITMVGARSVKNVLMANSVIFNNLFI